MRNLTFISILLIVSFVWAQPGPAQGRPTSPLPPNLRPNGAELKAPKGSGTPKVPNQKTPEQMKRDMLMEQVERALNPALKKMESPDDFLKTGGQDLGGGSTDEAEFNLYASGSIRLMRNYLPALMKLGLLTSEQSDEFQRRFPRGGKASLCVLISSQIKQGICPEGQRMIFIAVAEWKALAVPAKRLRALQALLRNLSTTEQSDLLDKTNQIMEIIQEEPEKFHRFETAARSSDAWMMSRDRDATKSYQTEIKAGEKEFLFIVRDQFGGEVTYMLNPASPLYHLDPCSADKSKDAFADILGSEYAYIELKPLAEACAKKIQSGQSITSFWVSERTKLVFKCD